MPGLSNIPPPNPRIRGQRIHWAALLCLICLFPKALFSQTLPPNDASDVLQLIGPRLHVGEIIIHSRSLRPIKDSYPTGISTDLAWQFLGKKSWEFCNCYPRAGLLLTYWDFDNRPILGQGLSAIGYVEPVFLTRHRFNLSVRMGGGIAYLNTPYDSLDNPLNLSYSTRINVPLVVGLGLHLRLNQRWSIRGGLSFNHVSNGGVSLPNKGINWPAADLGFDWAFRPFDFKARARRLDRSPPEQRLRLQIGGLASFKNTNFGSPKQYGIGGAYAKGIWYAGRWSGLSLGAEWVADRSRRIRMDQEGIAGRADRAAILAGHQFLLGRVVFSQEIGIYLWDQFPVDDPVYQRFSLLVFLHKGLFAGISLKTHLHVADFGDLRIGWEF